MRSACVFLEQHSSYVTACSLCVSSATVLMQHTACARAVLMMRTMQLVRMQSSRCTPCSLYACSPHATQHAACARAVLMMCNCSPHATQHAACAHAVLMSRNMQLVRMLAIIQQIQQRRQHIDRLHLAIASDTLLHTQP